METIATAKTNKPPLHADKYGRSSVEDDAEDIEECLCCDKPECTNCKQFVYYRAAWKTMAL